MIEKSFFKKHYSRLVAEGIVKSAIFGLLLGFGANFLAAFAAWMFDFGGIWLPIGIGAAVAAVSGVIAYFVKFRPTTQDIARRVDRLGLEERMVTMLELEKEESYIAMLQRENAREHMSDVNGKKISFKISKAMLSLMIAAAVLGSGMTTVTALADRDIIPSGSEIVNPEDPMANYIAVSYMADEGGVIEGESDQLLLAGESTTPVVAVAEDGWIFVGWEDGVKTPDRQDHNITEEMVLIALFQEIPEDGEDGESSEEGNSGGNQEGDKAEDLPAGGESNSNSEQGGQGEEGSGSGSDSNNEGGSGEGEEEGEGKGDGQGLGAGGKWEDSNQFIDGNTYYRDHLEMYYQMALEMFKENGEIPPELIEFFELYFDSI